MEELVNGEIQYVEMLTELQNNIIDPLEDRLERLPRENGFLCCSPAPFISEEDSSAIFDSLAPILAANRDLSMTLSERFLDWHEESTIGDVIVDWSHNINVAYTRYCENYDHASQLYGRAMQVPEFADFIEEASEGCRCSVQAVLVAPISRIARYRLLLGELVKCTAEDHPDAASLGDAADKLRRVAEELQRAAFTPR